MAEEELVEEPFKRFDVVSNHSDHYYVSLNVPNKGEAQDCFVNGGSRVYKKIIQEWKILEKNLPDSIFVRVYENRIDLLRAVIVGASGTPYHDALFFFDLAFPSNYPLRPPLVSYRSFGFRINPNLYENGWVCLSLLNTWAGKKIERWNPSESTILQVLVSIQALVLNEKPFFNEPGSAIFGKAFWERNSQAYNENTFLLSCKSILLLLRKPPMNFEAFVVGHFRDRANVILEACGEYANGLTRVGYYGNRNDGFSSSSDSNSGSVIEVSRKFRESMRVIYPELVAGFRKCGASLGHNVEQLTLIEVNSFSLLKPQEKVKKTKNGIGKRIIGKIKRILGLQKNDGSKSNAVATSERESVN
ncbi:hypothetical protein UlMin_009709 [Ulmus minor]